MADQAPARRHFIVGQDEMGELDRERSALLFADLEATLAALGGAIVITAQRTKIDEINGDPVAITTRLVAEWRAHSPLPMLDDTVPVPAPDFAEEPELPEDDPEFEPLELEEVDPGALEAELEIPAELEEESHAQRATRGAERLEAARAADPAAFELSPEELEDPVQT